MYPNANGPSGLAIESVIIQPLYLLKIGLLIFLENACSQDALGAAEGVFGISVL